MSGVSGSIGWVGVALFALLFWLLRMGIDLTEGGE